ncbi:hypothetical protein HOG21_08120 [bacterium]|nr:hypothetical protein [bacterium]
MSDFVLLDIIFEYILAFNPHLPFRHLPLAGETILLENNKQFTFNFDHSCFCIKFIFKSSVFSIKE